MFKIEQKFFFII